jgi:hypothetical protein
MNRVVPVSPVPSSLVRFVTDGLLATIESYRAGQLPLHRFTWELHSRIDTLSELSADRLTLTRLRWLHRTIDNLHAELLESGRRPTVDEENTLTVTVVSLRTVLGSLTPPAPLDPSGAAAPAAERRRLRVA